MNIPLPTIDIKEVKDNRAQIIIEPCYPGYGVTLGNSLRRVLLSSLEGGAVTAFKVKGIQHEFSYLPNIKEDMIEIMLNLKAIRLKVFSEEPITLSLKVKGEKEVKASDIDKNAQVEIINPGQTICTITDKNGEIDMELITQRGRGYLTVEEREKEIHDIGTIIIDAIFSPLKNVGFEVENMRVGERTDYERLILKIETDGTITSTEALKQATDILVQHFELIKGKEVDKKAVKPIVKEKESKEMISEVKSEIKGEEKQKRKRGRPKKSDK